jgi:hypothetical protein
MSGIAIQIAIPRDTATPAVNRILGGLAPTVLNPIVGRAATSLYKKHLIELSLTRRNALGGTSTGFYSRAAQGTNFRAVGDHVVVSIASVGIAQRYFGGTIRPRQAKFLTIPASKEAYGKRASEFNDLKVLVGRNGPYALARRAATLISIGNRNRAGVRAVGRVGEQGGEVLFWLKKEVTQQPDPTVLPSEEAVGAAVQRAVTAHVDLMVARSGGPQS